MSYPLIKTLAALLLSTWVCIVSPCESYDTEETYVYICTGNGSYRYHKHKTCRGLNNCQADIKRVSVSYAISKKRTPCKICF